MTDVREKATGRSGLKAGARRYLVAAWAVYATTLGPVRPDAWAVLPDSPEIFIKELFTTQA